VPDEVTLTIDGKQITVPKGTLVIEAAKKLGIDIPVFCYHTKLEPVGACRQCLVKIEGFPKPQVSCSTQVADGMVVHVNTPEVKQMWESMLEFLLINHPLDCPVCDRGGECPLQDNTFKYGPPDSRFEHEKRHSEKPVPLSSLVLLDRERCILCFRCVRFQREIADQPDIYVANRGYGDYIDIFPGRPFESNFSGNTIELCPVGALLSSLFRFRARPWEITKTESICPNCSVGCNITIDDRRRRYVVRFLARINDEVNEHWLCDRGRFNSHTINDPARLVKPLVRKNGELQEASWEEALTVALEGIRAAGNRAGGIGSPARTNEANYLFQKFMRQVIGTNNVDYTFEKRTDSSTGDLASAIASGFFNGRISDIAESDAILCLGSDISYDLPLLDLWIKKAVRKLGKNLVFAYPLKAELAKYARPFLSYHYGQEAEFTRELASAVSGTSWQPLAGVRMEDIDLASEVLKSANYVTVMVAKSMIESAENGRDVLKSLQWIADSLKSRNVRVQVMLLVQGANTFGAMDVGLLPGYLPGYKPADKGLTGWEMLEKAGSDISALWIMGQNPARDLLHSEAFTAALQKLDMLVVQDHILTETARYAHVVLPSSTFAETEGTFTNTERRIQRINPAIRRVGNSKADTDIIIEAASLAGADFNYSKVEEILTEISNTVPQYQGVTFDAIGPFGRYLGDLK